MIKMKTILHPTDFSESSNYALKCAASLAREFGAKLYILHVIEDVSTMSCLEPCPVMPAAPVTTELENRARKALEQVLPPEVRDAISTECALLRGVPFLEIIRYARQIQADIIVCGTHGRTGLKHLLFGSVAENVVRNSPCPVLSVRHPEHRFEMPV
jgi:universal stress protein A